MSAIAVCTRDGLSKLGPGKVNFITQSRHSWNPLEREMSVLAMTEGGPTVPSARTRRTLIAHLRHFQKANKPKRTHRTVVKHPLDPQCHRHQPELVYRNSHRHPSKKQL